MIRLIQNQNVKKKLTVDYFVKISICDALSEFNDNACKVKLSPLNSRK